jgi:hypothetical protein
MLQASVEQTIVTEPLSRPYVEAARVIVNDSVNPASYTYFDRPLLFISGGRAAAHYPAAAPNARGDLGTTSHYSDSTFDPYFAVGIDDDYHRFDGGWDVQYIRPSSQGPTTNRYGDYFKVTAYNPDDLTWASIGTTMQGCGGAGCNESNFVIFGRERDSNGTPLFNTANRDFNGNGKSDLLFCNSASGDLIEWQIDGTNVASAASVGGATPTGKSRESLISTAMARPTSCGAIRFREGS